MDRSLAQKTSSISVALKSISTTSIREMTLSCSPSPGVAWVDPSDSLSTIECFDSAGNRLRNSGCFEEGTWHRLDPDEDYEILAEAGYIILNRAVSAPHAMAVHFKTRAPDFDGTLQRETARLNAGAESDSLHLKLIKAAQCPPRFSHLEPRVEKRVPHCLRVFHRPPLRSQDFAGRYRQRSARSRGSALATGPLLLAAFGFGRARQRPR